MPGTSKEPRQFMVVLKCNTREAKIALASFSGSQSIEDESEDLWDKWVTHDRGFITEGVTLAQCSLESGSLEHQAGTGNF